MADAIGATFLIQALACSITLTDRLESACCERVPDISRNAGAGGDVALHSTDRIDPAGAGTGVDTVELLTCFVRRAVGADHALGPACGVGVPEVVRDAGAAPRPAPLPALRVGAARRGAARVHYLNRNRR